MNVRSALCPFVLLSLLVVAGSPLVEGEPLQAPADEIPTMGYTDAAFGFEMQIPAGWSYDRSRFQKFKDSIGLLRGHDQTGRHGLQIQIFRVQPIEMPGHEGEAATVRMPSFEDWIVDFGKALAEITGSERVVWETLTLPPRACALLKYDSKIGASTTRTYTLCVPFDASTVWVFVLSGSIDSADEEAWVGRLFDLLAGSLHVHYDPANVEQLATAFERGLALITRLRDEAANVRLDENEYFYDMTIGGKPIGYMQRRVAREEYVFTAPSAKHRVAQEGLRVRERSWRFADDGTVRHSRLDLFSSFDMNSELIENEQSQLPAPDVQPQQVLVKTDQAVRKAGILVSSYRTNLDRALPEPTTPLSVGPVYMDLAWLRLAPGLLLTAPQESHAFAVYNTDTRSLISQLMTPLGRRELEGSDEEAYAFEVREGLIDRPTLLHVDRRGNLLRMIAGDLIIQRVSKEQVERTYGARRDEACKRFGLKDD